LIVNLKRWRYGTENSAATKGTEGHCGAQRRTTRQSGEIHQLHHVGLLMVSRALIVSPRRWRNSEWLCMATRGDGLLCTAANFSFSAHAPAKGVGQGFNREPRTMAMERIARRCDGPKSKNLQRLGFACFHHEGLADMRPSFNRELGTMGKRCKVMRSCA
jgi:hypothetical protein